MRLEPVYRATWTTPEAYSVELTGQTGTEGRSFFLAEGRTQGRLSARLRAANAPRRRVDGALTPDFHGVLETGDARYARLNDRVCALAGEVRPDGDGGFEVVIDVSEIVWEPVE